MTHAIADSEFQFSLGSVAYNMSETVRYFSDKRSQSPQSLDCAKPPCKARHSTTCNHGGQRVTRLEWMVGNANEEEMNRLKDAIQELLVSGNLEEHEMRAARNLPEQIAKKIERLKNATLVAP